MQYSWRNLDMNKELVLMQAASTPANANLPSYHFMWYGQSHDESMQTSCTSLIYSATSTTRPTLPDHELYGFTYGVVGGNCALDNEGKSFGSTPR